MVTLVKMVGWLSCIEWENGGLKRMLSGGGDSKIGGCQIGVCPDTSANVEANRHTYTHTHTHSHTQQAHNMHNANNTNTTTK